MIVLAIMVCSNQTYNLSGTLSKDDEACLFLDHSQDNNQLQRNGDEAASDIPYIYAGALCQCVYTHVLHIYYNRDFQVVLDGAYDFHMDLAFPMQWLYH